jgi:hypothetical protein
MSSLASDEAPPPPYQTKCDGFGLLVAHDEALVRSLLPPGIEPVDEMSGGINLYAAGQGYGLAPFSAFYFYVHVKGFDSSDGTEAAHDDVVALARRAAPRDEWPTLSAAATSERSFDEVLLSPG